MQQNEGEVAVSAVHLQVHPVAVDRHHPPHHLTLITNVVAVISISIVRRKSVIDLDVEEVHLHLVPVPVLQDVGLSLDHQGVNQTGVLIRSETRYNYAIHLLAPTSQYDIFPYTVIYLCFSMFLY